MGLVYAANSAPQSFAAKLAELLVQHPGDDVARLVFGDPKLLLLELKGCFAVPLTSACQASFPELPREALEKYITDHLEWIIGYDYSDDYNSFGDYNCLVRKPDGLNKVIHSPKNVSIVAEQFDYVIKQSLTWLRAKGDSYASNTDAFSWLQQQPKDFTLLCGRDLWGVSNSTMAEKGYMGSQTGWTDIADEDWKMRLSDWTQQVTYDIRYRRKGAVRRHMHMLRM